MSVTEAVQKCPELVLVNGEDLTPFRDTSKILFNFFKQHSWNHKVERLGFDEVFMGMYVPVVLTPLHSPLLVHNTPCSARLQM